MMIKAKTKILLISASSKSGGGPSHIFLLKDILKEELNRWLVRNKYLEIAERKLLPIDILRLILFSKKNSIDIIHAHGKGAGIIARIIKIFLNNH